MVVCTLGKIDNLWMGEDSSLHFVGVGILYSVDLGLTVGVVAVSAFINGRSSSNNDLIRRYDYAVITPLSQPNFVPSTRDIHLRTRALLRS